MIVVHVIRHFRIQNTRKYIKPEKLQLTDVLKVIFILHYFEGAN